MIALRTLYAYWRTRRLRFKSRQQLEAYQQKKLAQFSCKILSCSPWFSAFRQLPFQQWPLMNKSLMMAHFDQMNTAGLHKQQLLALAQASESSRDFSARVGRYSVGLSSGTSGQRGLFVVSPQEQQIWAGVMLAKMLPQGLLSGERVALFLRADNNLYHSVDNRWLSLAFFDLFAPFSQQLSRLQQFKPTIIVAPAQVLRELALAVQSGEIELHCKKVISVAEVLEPQDRHLLEQVFHQVAEVYQATEGFLAASCEHGSLHLNEEFLYIEKQWLDEQRFTPIITDFSRITQPIVRYCLDDVLVLRSSPCPCGRVTTALSAIEGRCDDLLLLPSADGEVKTIFADVCHRVIANSLPLICDYRLIQQGEKQLQLIGDCSQQQLAHCQQQLNQLFQQQGVAIGKLQWHCLVQPIGSDFTRKRRRIIRQSVA